VLRPLCSMCEARSRAVVAGECVRRTAGEQAHSRRCHHVLSQRSRRLHRRKPPAVTRPLRVTATAAIFDATRVPPYRASWKCQVAPTRVRAMGHGLCSEAAVARERRITRARGQRLPWREDAVAAPPGCSR
jgi:hypothetical protein